MNNYPKSKDEWWQFVDKYWDDLQNIILNYYPNQSDFPEDGWPLSDKLQKPQQACNAVIKKLRKENPIWQDRGSFKDYVNNLKETRDVKLDNIFQASWFGMPESGSSRSVPGFYVFCDLCSEASVLYR